MCQALVAHPQALVLYVNRMYVVNSAVFERTEATQLKVGTTIGDSSAIINGSFAYTYANQQTYTSTFPNSVLNIVGQRLDPTGSAGAGDPPLLSCGSPGGHPAADAIGGADVRPSKTLYLKENGTLSFKSQGLSAIMKSAKVQTSSAVWGSVHPK